MNIKELLSVLALMLSSSASHAMEIYRDDDWQWSISGFGTLGAVYATDRNAGYLRDISQLHGANGFSIDTDSRLGLQTNLKWHDIEIVAQTVSRYRYNSYTPELTMGFVKFVPFENVSVRGGRLLADFYSMSESRNIGYSYLPIRPSVEHLGPNYINYFDGGDISYRMMLEDGFLSFKAFAGYTPEFAVIFNKKVNLSKFLYGAQIDAQWNDWKARVGFNNYNFGENLYDVEPGIDSVAKFVSQPSVLNSDPQAATILRELTTKGKSGQYYNAALSWMPSPFSAELSLAFLTSHGNKMTTSRLFVGFLNLGYQIEKWTPFFMFSWSQPVVKKHLTRLSPVYGPTSGLVNQALANVENYLAVERQTYSFGLRYDFATNMDLKFQMDIIQSRPDTLLWEIYPNRKFDGNSVLFGLSFDFIF